MCQRPIQTRSMSAFTLVELLVVIGIIALLISILLPTLGRARAAAQNIKCQSNLHTIGLAIAIYQNQFKNYFPAASTGNLPTDTHWDATLQQLLGRTGNITYGSGTVGTVGSLGQAFLCPSHVVEPSVSGTYECDYSTHPRLMPQLQDTDYGLGQASTTHMHLVKVTQVRSPSDIVLVMDGTQVNPLYDGFGIYPNYCAWPACDNIDTAKFAAFPGLCLGLPGDNTDQTQPVYVRYVVDALANNGHSEECVRWRHNNYANFLFVDGHVAQFYCNPKNLDTSGQDYNGHYITNLMRRNVWLPYMP